MVPSCPGGGTGKGEGVLGGASPEIGHALKKILPLALKTKTFFCGHKENFHSTAPAPSMTTALPALLMEATLVFPSFPRPAIGFKELFATSPCAAIRQQHNTDCTVHKEPAMLQTPSFKHLAHGLQGLACQSINPGPSGECQDRMLES